MNEAPIWRAKEKFEQLDPPYTWEDVLKAHLAQGYCVSSPDYFICARPVCSTAHYRAIIDPFHEFEPERWDAWFVWIAAGSALPSLWTVLPHDLPWVMFYRRGRSSLRKYDNRKLRNKSHGRITENVKTTEAGTTGNSD